MFGAFRWRFTAFFGGLARFLERGGRVFVGLARKLMGSEAPFPVRGRGSCVGVCGKVVVFSGAIVWALGH
jgi:hypothetical protein